MTRTRNRQAALILMALAPALEGCAVLPGPMALDERECMTRAMYFESNRSSRDGMLAVGTTVMNRLASPRYPKTVCGVVGQPGQFAEGVLTKPMNRREAEPIAHVADEVLSGARHPQVGSAMFFHTAGLTFPYHNMHYVAVAGGNAFYEKTQSGQHAGSIIASVLPPAAASPIVAAQEARPPRSIDDLLSAMPALPPPGRRLTASASAFDEAGIY